MLDDGVNSAKRYFINNFKDPRYQKGIDILLGEISDRVSPFLKQLKSKTLLNLNNQKLKSKNKNKNKNKNKTIMKIGIRKIEAKIERREKDVFNDEPKGSNVNNQSKKFVWSIRSDKKLQFMDASSSAISHVFNTEKILETNSTKNIIDPIDRIFEELVNFIEKNI